jgi:hypothetical protein
VVSEFVSLRLRQPSSSELDAVRGTAAPKSEALLLVHKSTLLWVIISGIFAQLGYWLHCSPFGRLTSCIFFLDYMPLGRRNFEPGPHYGRRLTSRGVPSQYKLVRARRPGTQHSESKRQLELLAPRPGNAIACGQSRSPTLLVAPAQPPREGRSRQFQTIPPHLSRLALLLTIAPPRSREQRTPNGRMLASARDSLGRTGELGPRAIVGAFLTRKTNLAVLALQALLPQGRRIVAYPDRAPSSALEFAPEDFKAISNELRVVGACSAWQSCDHAPVAAGTFLFHHEMPRTNSLTIDVDRRRKRPPRF